MRQATCSTPLIYWFSEPVSCSGHPGPRLTAHWNHVRYIIAIHAPQQYSALHCITIHCTHCSVLQYTARTALYYSTLHALHCITVHFTHCTVLQYTARTALYYRTLHALHCITVHFTHCTVLYYTARTAQCTVHCQH